MDHVMLSQALSTVTLYAKLEAECDRSTGDNRQSLLKTLGHVYCHCLAQQSGTVSRISSGTRQSALTLSDVY